MTSISHPSLSDPDAARADDLHDWLMSSRPLEWWAESASTTDGLPRWYTRLHSELLLLTTGDDIEAVFVTPNVEAFAAAVTVVSTHRLVFAHVDATENADSYEANAISRRGVRDVRVEERFGLIGRDSRREWPGDLTVIVRVAGLPEPLRFGPSPHTTVGARRPDMYAVLKSFLVNLGANRPL